MRHTRYVLLLAFFALTSCRDIATDPHMLDGAWIALDEGPGMSLGFVLTTNGNSISGAGNWTGEAIAGGTVSVAGEVAQGDVSLDLTFKHVINGVVQDQGQFVEHFSGMLTSHNDLKGSTTLNGQQAPLHLRRASVP